MNYNTRKEIKEKIYKKIDELTQKGELPRALGYEFTEKLYNELGIPAEHWQEADDILFEVLKEQGWEKRGTPRHCKGVKAILMKEEELLELAYRVYGIYQRRRDELYKYRTNLETEEFIDDYEILYDVVDWETERIYYDNDIDVVIVVYREDNRKRYALYDEDVFKGALIDLVMDIESGENPEDIEEI